MKITKPIFKVIIAGGRDFSNYELLQEKCDHLLRNKLLTHNVQIVSDCARGADALGIKYAEELKLNVLKFPADWEKFGKRAGYLRMDVISNTIDDALDHKYGRDSDCLYLEKVRNELDNIFKEHKNLFKND